MRSSLFTKRMLTFLLASFLIVATVSAFSFSTFFSPSTVLAQDDEDEGVVEEDVVDDNLALHKKIDLITELAKENNFSIGSGKSVSVEN